METEGLVLTIWGEEKTGKTSLALTFPKPLIHFDLDIGGFNRAKWRVDTKEVKSTPYFSEDVLQKLLKGDLTIRPSHKVYGMKELWTKIITEYAHALLDKEAATIVIDSGTQLWSICHSAVLQEKQEMQILKNPKIQDADLRERLQPIEYGEPNKRMRALISAAHGYKKILVLTHYPRDIYVTKMMGDRAEEVKSGEIEPDGFKENRRLTDLEVKTFMKVVPNTTGKGTHKVPSCRITLSGLTLDAVDIELEPNYDKIIEVVNALRGEAS